jgi:hypothetical protein
MTGVIVERLALDPGSTQLFRHGFNNTSRLIDLVKLRRHRASSRAPYVFSVT